MSPEEKFFRGAVGKRVDVVLVAGAGDSGEYVLIWVDKFTVGLQEIDGPVNERVGGVFLVFKHGIISMGVLGDAPPSTTPTDP